MRKSFCKVLAAALGVMMLSGCSGKQDGAGTSAADTASEAVQGAIAAETLSGEVGLVEGKEADEVSVGVPWVLSDLAPYGRVTSARQMILPVVYEYLGYFDANAENGMVGIMMKNFTKVDNYTYEVEIYDYIKDSAGNDFTADDVIFSLHTWRDSQKSVKCKCLDHVEKIDDYTVRIHLTEYTGVGDIQNILSGLVPMVTEAAYTASGDGMLENVISTSPYKIESYTSGSSLTVVRRDDYWQTDESLIQTISKTNAKKINYNIITEQSQLAINLETNAIDIAPYVSANEVTRFAAGGNSADGYKVFAKDSANFEFITFNCEPEKGMFADKLEARQAFCYALDAQGIIDGYLNGQGSVMKAFANNTCAEYNPEWNEWDYYEYDLEKAKELLEQSGFDTSKTVRVMLDSQWSGMAPILQAYWEMLGVNVELLVYDAALYQTYVTDPDQWDIMVNAVQSIMYVSDLGARFAIVPDTGLGEMGFTVDEQLETLCKNVASLDHTQEDVDAWMEYIKENAYGYALYRENCFFVAEDTVAELFTNFKTQLIPSACTYSAEFTR